MSDTSTADANAFSIREIPHHEVICAERDSLWRARDAALYMMPGADSGIVSYGLFFGAAPAGVIRLKTENKTAEIQFIWLAEEHRGKGLMCRSLHMLLRDLAAENSLKTIVASPFCRSASACRVLDRLGFVRDATEYSKGVDGKFSYRLSAVELAGTSAPAKLQPMPERRPRRLIVTASIGRLWNQYGEESVRAWAQRLGAALHVRNQPFSAGRKSHPWFFKWDIIAEAVAIYRPEEVVWIDDDIVVRADADWPEYSDWALFYVPEIIQAPDTTSQKAGLIGSNALTHLGWNQDDDGYYNTGLVFIRHPRVAELLEVGFLSRCLEHNQIPDQAAIAQYLVGKEVTPLPDNWHIRGPGQSGGVLEGYFNHFLGGNWDGMNELGPLWPNLPA